VVVADLLGLLDLHRGDSMLQLGLPKDRAQETAHLNVEARFAA